MTDNKETPEYIAVGRFGKTRGVSGEIYINLLTDFPDRFQKGKIFWIESEDGWKKIKLASGKSFSSRVAVKIKGINTPEEVRKFTNYFLYIKRDELQKLPEDKFYLFDLVNCRVIDEEKYDYGQVVDIEENPANDLLIIEAKDGGRYLFPMVREFIKEIDTDGKKIVVDPPEGIFDSSDET